MKLPEPGTGVDRLSSLPEDVLTHILSFLETKYAVGTAVLSRRWTDLWTRVSNLDLDDSLTYQPRSYYEQLLDRGYKSIPTPELNHVSEVKKSRGREFSRFVDRVLSQHRNLNSLRRFRLRFSADYRAASPDSWREMELDPASQVEEIDVSLPSCARQLPESFYALTNLKVLKLAGVTLIAAVPVLLPCVKMLKLSRVATTTEGGGEALSRFISCFPVLETAHLEECYCSSSSDINVNRKVTASLPFVKKLTVIGGRNRNWDATLRPIAIEAPCLVRLELQDFEELETVGNRPLSCLESVTVHFSEDDYYERQHHSLIGLLAQFSNAKQMRFSGRTLILLSDFVRGVPDFPKLVHLTIEFSGRSCRAFHSLLNSAPKLQTLVIHLGDADAPMRWEKSLEPACAPAGLSSSLEEIEIHGLVAVSNEMRMVRYLLKAGAVLKKVNMNVHVYHVDDCRRLASLLKLPRASSACKVCFFQDGIEISMTM